MMKVLKRRSSVPLLLGDLLLWQLRNLPVEMMLSTVYLAMASVMIAASKNPLDHKSFIDFLILANLAHANMMLFSARNWWHMLDVLAVGSLVALPPVLLSMLITQILVLSEDTMIYFALRTLCCSYACANSHRL
jgi:O-antigen ligase